MRLLFPSTRPECPCRRVRPRQPGWNWAAVLGIQGAAAATVGELSAGGVAEVLVAAGIPAWVREDGPLRTLVKRIEGDPVTCLCWSTALLKEEVPILRPARAVIAAISVVYPAERPLQPRIRVTLVMTARAVSQQLGADETAGLINVRLVRSHREVRRPRPQPSPSGLGFRSSPAGRPSERCPDQRRWHGSAPTGFLDGSADRRAMLGMTAARHLRKGNLCDDFEARRLHRLSARPPPRRGVGSLQVQRPDLGRGQHRRFIPSPHCHLDPLLASEQARADYLAEFSSVAWS